jgi:hypothetical protein
MMPVKIAAAGQSILAAFSGLADGVAELGKRSAVHPMPAELEQVDQATIEVRIRELGQIFNSLDPSPFTERDLDDDAEEYIVGWAREVDTGAPIRIVVHLPVSETQKARERGLESAIGNYFAYRVGMLERDLRDLFRVGRRSLGIGIAVLAICIGLSQVLSTALPQSALGQLLAEGIMIFGWVANWRPAEILLYDLWAVRRRVALYRRLADARIELKSF